MTDGIVQDRAEHTGSTIYPLPGIDPQREEQEAIRGQDTRKERQTWSDAVKKG